MAVLAAHDSPSKLTLSAHDADNVDADFYYNYTWNTHADILMNPSFQRQNGRTFLFDLGGQVPCCVQSSVPVNSSSSAVDFEAGGVMGYCDPVAQTATITWLGKTLEQEFSQAQMLTVTLIPIPGSAPLHVSKSCWHQ